jgi:hypothetical protein
MEETWSRTKKEINFNCVRFWAFGLQSPAHAGSSLADFSTLKMEAIRSSETSLNARSTQRHIPEDDILHVLTNCKKIQQ